MFFITYNLQLFEEDDLIVSLCPELNVSSFGDTPEEAVDSLKEAVSLFLEGCQEMGTLEAVLEEAGYRLVDGRWIHTRTNMTTAGMSRERYLELLEEVQ